MNSLQSKAEIGFNYLVEVVRGTVFDEADPRKVIREGVVIEQETVHNLIPTEGLNHIMGVAFKSVPQVPTWYIAIYEGNFTPTDATAAATFPAAATECTAYTPAARVEYVEGAVATGSIDNTASKAEFTMTADKTIYGAVISSASAKGATTGVIVSAVRFATAKAVLTGDVLRLTAINTLASVA